MDWTLFALVYIVLPVAVLAVVFGYGVIRNKGWLMALSFLVAVGYLLLLALGMIPGT